MHRIAEFGEPEAKVRRLPRSALRGEGTGAPLLGDDGAVKNERVVIGELPRDGAIDDGALKAAAVSDPRDARFLGEILIACRDGKEGLFVGEILPTELRQVGLAVLDADGKVGDASGDHFFPSFSEKSRIACTRRIFPSSST